MACREGVNVHDHSFRRQLCAAIAGCLQVGALTNGSADSVAKPVLTAAGVMQLCKGPMLDINMAQVGLFGCGTHKLQVSKQ